MKTFKEWVEKSHPEDEVLNEFLRDLAVKAANSRMGRTAIAAGALAMGAAGAAPEAKGAMPMAPKITTSQEGYSDKPFSRELTIELAKEMSADPRVLSKMSDFELWNWQVRKVDRLVDEMGRHQAAIRNGAMGMGVKEWPLWYIKLGHHYGWKAPKPPEVLASGGGR